MLGRKIFITLWTNALRFGGYSQGAGSLCDLNNNFCCLGVICNELVKLDLIEKFHHQFAVEFGKEFSADSTVLPVDVQDLLEISASGNFDWAKLSPSTIDKLKFDSYGELCHYVTLTNVNDSGKFDFNFIADLIEEIEENNAWA